MLLEERERKAKLDNWNGRPAKRRWSSHVGDGFGGWDRIGRNDRRIRGSVVGNIALCRTPTLLCERSRDGLSAPSQGAALGWGPRGENGAWD